jgi:hypothetical protein
MNSNYNLFNISMHMTTLLRAWKFIHMKMFVYNKKDKIEDDILFVVDQPFFVIVIAH